MTAQDYEDAILGFCAANPAATIYQAGEVSEPGFSDLDFVVFGENQPTIPENVRHLLMGGNVILVPKSHASLINHFERFTLRHLQGDVYDFEDPPDQHMTVVEIIEWLPERIMKLEYALEKKQRASLHLIQKSLNRSIKKVSVLTGQKYKTTDSKTFRLRMNNAQRLECLASQLVVAKCCWHDFEQYLLDNGTIKKLADDAANNVNICDYYQFQNEYNLLASYFFALSDIDSRISRKLSNCVGGTSGVQFSPDIQEFMIKRWTLLGQMYDWFVAKGFDKGMIKYGWFL